MTASLLRNSKSRGFNLRDLRERTDDPPLDRSSGEYFGRRQAYQNSPLNTHAVISCGGGARFKNAQGHPRRIQAQHRESYSSAEWSRMDGAKRGWTSWMHLQCFIQHFTSYRHSSHLASMQKITRAAVARDVLLLASCPSLSTALRNVSVKMWSSRSTGWMPSWLPKGFLWSGSHGHRLARLSLMWFHIRHPLDLSQYLTSGLINNSNLLRTAYPNVKSITLKRCCGIPHLRLW